MKLGELRKIFKGLPADMEVVFYDRDGRNLGTDLRYYEPTPLEPYGKAVFVLKKEFIHHDPVSAEPTPEPEPEAE